jgi:hypothetical protein
MKAQSKLVMLTPELARICTLLGAAEAAPGPRSRDRLSPPQASLYIQATRLLIARFMTGKTG